MNSEGILRKFSSFSIGPIVGAAINLLTTPVITYFISPEEYGKASMFTLALSIIQLMVFLGMDQAYAKRYYESEDKSSLFINAVAPSIILVIVFEVVAYLIRNSLSTWLFDSSNEVDCVYCLIAIVPALAAERFLMLGIRMSQRGKLYSAMTITLKILILVATVGCLSFFQKSFRSVIVGTTIAQIIFAFLLWFKQRKELSINLQKLELNEIYLLLKFGLPLVPTTIIGWILTGMDKVMLRSMCTYSDLGIYGVAAKIAAVLTILQTCFTTFWVPLAYQWHSEKKPLSSFTRVGRYVTSVMSITFLLVIIFRDIIFLLFPSSYNGAKYVVPFLLFTPIMYTISEVTVMGIYFNEKTGWTVIVSLASGIVNLCLNTILIPKLGAIGAAIATGFSYITFFWIRTILSRRIWFNFPLKDYVIVTIVLVTNAFISSLALVREWGALMINSASVIILFLMFRNEITELISSALRILKGLLKENVNN